jgi:hypothetical protein
MAQMNEGSFVLLLLFFILKMSGTETSYNGSEEKVTWLYKVITKKIGR